MYYHYKIYKSTKGGYYSFKTKNEITYRCFFSQNISKNDLLGCTINSEVYFFSFNRMNRNQYSEYDRFTGITIAEILNRFFTKNPNGIICYICENNDLKAIKRQESFSRWLKTRNTEPKKTLIKGEIAGLIYVGVIMQQNHSEKEKIQNYFIEEITTFNKTDKKGTIEIID